MRFLDQYFLPLLTVGTFVIARRWVADAQFQAPIHRAGRLRVWLALIEWGKQCQRETLADDSWPKRRNVPQRHLIST